MRTGFLNTSSGAGSGPPALSGHSLFLLAPQAAMMTKVCNFVARPGKRFAKIKTPADVAFWVKVLKKASINFIIKKDKADKNNNDDLCIRIPRRPRELLTLVPIAADIKEDLRMTCKELASSHTVSNGTVHKILHDELGLVKKLGAQASLQELEKEEKENLQGCHCCHQPSFHSDVGQYCKHGRDNGVLLQYMSEMKKQSKQYIKKGQPGPIKAKVQASWTKQNAIGLLRQQRPLSTSTLCQGIYIYANYFVKASGKFLAHLKKKRPEMIQQDWFFHWDDAPLHTVASVKKWCLTVPYVTVEAA